MIYVHSNHSVKNIFVLIFGVCSWRFWILFCKEIIGEVNSENVNVFNSS